MRLVFTGVGEACDERYPNTSLLLRTSGEGRGGTCLLLDCGFTSTHQYFRHCAGADELDAVWISHAHGDHFMGLPLLLLRLWEEGREKPLTVVGQSGISGLVTGSMDLAYGGLRSKLPFGLRFVEAEPGEQFDLLGLRWHTEVSEHFQRNLALRIDEGEKSLYYSGDGRPNRACADLAAGVSLIVHEGFLLQGEWKGHGSVEACLEFARQAGAERLAVVHMQREVRRLHAAEARGMLNRADWCSASLPEPGDEIEP
jgi:ribonuclease BN (tRNA processing enzyme)